MIDSDAINRFRRIGTMTVCAVYFLILVGAIVRASGAGMGCPDWPTCFGQLIPPTDETQLPANYHEIYAERGYADTRFNPVKTWTEYVNRLVGVGTGLLILSTCWCATALRKIDATIFRLALTVVFLVGFQAWLGSAVVASNLRPIVITAHMTLALVIVGLLIYVVLRSQRSSWQSLSMSGLPEKYQTVLLVLLGMTLLQITMGTQIREAMESVANVVAPRNLWREHFPIIFYIHRSFSSIILFTNLWLIWRTIKTLGISHILSRFTLGLMVVIVCAILSGVTLDRLGYPAFVQPFHLLFASLIFGLQFTLWQIYRYVRV